MAVIKIFEEPTILSSEKIVIAYGNRVVNKTLSYIGKLD